MLFPMPLFPEDYTCHQTPSHAHYITNVIFSPPIDKFYPKSIISFTTYHFDILKIQNSYVNNL